MRVISDDAVARLRAVTALPELPEARYTLLEVLGTGGMGTVYRGFDTLLDREVAIKVAHAAVGPGSAAFTGRLRAEARVLASLEHPGIVPVHDVGVMADGRVFQVMKRVQGDTLETAVHRLPELDRRLGILERVADAVAFAHRHGVVHRDLKPANIMVGEFGEVLVLDWGVAKVLGAVEPAPEDGPPVGQGMTDPGTAVGTPGFMAPEQAAGAGLDQRADVYALGALLRFLGEADPSAGDLPRPLRAIAARCQAAAPADRYADAAEVAEEIRRFRSGSRVRAHRERWVERVGRTVRTYRTPILLVVAYLIMRVVVAFVRR